MTTPDTDNAALTAALAHAAEIKSESLNPAFVYDVALSEIVTLSNEVLRLRSESVPARCRHVPSRAPDPLGYCYVCGEALPEAQQ